MPTPPLPRACCFSASSCSPLDATGICSRSRRGSLPFSTTFFVAIPTHPLYRPELLWALIHFPHRVWGPPLFCMRSPSVAEVFVVQLQFCPRRQDSRFFVQCLRLHGRFQILGSNFGMRGKVFELWMKLGITPFFLAGSLFLKMWQGH